MRLVSILLLCGTVIGNEVTQGLLDVSVTIKSKYGEGSGVVFTRGDGINYVWTAAHVLDDLRSTRQTVDPETGTPRTVIQFEDAKVMQRLVEDGRTVGKTEMDAEVIRYSDSENGHDLALLRVRKKGFVGHSVKFYLDNKIPTIGTRLFHVGSLKGQFGSNSLTAGILSQQGRLLDGKPYDQTTVTAFPGSSGGGVFLEDGRYIGMLTRGAGETFNLIVPIRRVRQWAKDAGIEWAIDPKVKMPDAEALEAMPVEDIGVKFKGSPKKKD